MRFLHRMQPMQMALGCATVITIAACSEPKYVPKPLPALVAPTPASERTEIKPAQLGLVAGERMIYEVRVRGFAIGRAEMTVGEGEVRSHFGTSGLASAMATVRHDLVTELDAHRPRASREYLDLDGTARQISTSFTGTTSHSAHTALGAVRAWAAPDATAGFLHIVFMDQLVRLDLERPAQVQDFLRVDGKITGLDAPVSLTLWLDAKRRFTRIEVRSQGEQITATPAY